MEWIKGLECDGLDMEIQSPITPKIMIHVKMKKNRADNILQ